MRLLECEFENEFCIVDAKIKKQNKLPRKDIKKALELVEKCYEERKK